MYMNLGRDLKGKEAGRLVIRGKIPDDTLAQPTGLGCESGTGVSQIRLPGLDAFGWQVVAPETFVNIVRIHAQKYEIRCYPPSAAHPSSVKVVNANGEVIENPFYEVSGDPFVIWQVEAPRSTAALTNGEPWQLNVAEVRGTMQRSWNYTYATNASQTGWVLLSGGGLRSDSKLSSQSPVTGNRLEQRVIGGPTGQCVSEKTSEFHAFPWGESRVREQNGQTGNGLETVWGYYGDTSNSGRYSRVSNFVRADGFQRFFDYDFAGRKTSLTDPWKDGGADQVVTEYDYTPVDVRDVPGTNNVGDAKQPRTTTRKVAGTVVERSFSAYIETNGARTVIHEQAGAQDAAYGDARNLRTITTYYSTNEYSYWSGRIQLVDRPDGTLETHAYSQGNYVAVSNEPGVFIEGAGQFVREAVYHGTRAIPDGVPGKSTEDVNIYDSLGRLLLKEGYICTVMGAVRVSWVANKYDDMSHLTDSYGSDGTHSQSVWGDCCGKETETDVTGTETFFEYDALKRIITKIRSGVPGVWPDVVTGYGYDAEGRVVMQEQYASGLRMLVVSNQYDTANRLVWSMDQTGIATTYLYNGLTNTVMRGGLTNVTVNYLDGKTHYTLENGAIKSWNEYGVNSDGRQWTKAYTGPAGANSPVWSKTTTDMLGHTVLEEKPGYGGVILTNAYVYNAKGQLTSTTLQANNLTTLYEYNELGQQFRSGLDINTNGTLDLVGPDRINASDTSYQSDSSNNWWQARTSILYAGNNSATPATNSIQKARLTGLGSISALGSLNSELVSSDLLGNSTISRTFINRAAKAVRQVVTHPGSTNNSEQVSINGFIVTNQSVSSVVSVFTYDAVGRQTSALQGGAGASRTVATYTTYNSLGQIASSMDAASNTTSFTYDVLGRRIAVTDALSNTTHTAYDTVGHVLATWGATYPVAYEYDDYGRMTAMYTYRGTNPISSYSEISNLKSEMDQTRWLYDATTGLLTNKLYADGHGPSYTYTPDGKLATRTWARGIVTTYGYDNLGQLTNINYSVTNTPTVTFAYDRLGRQITVTDGTGTRAYTYNDALQLAAETNTQGNLTYAFDNLGRSAGFDAGPNYSVRYAYDPFGRFASVSSTVMSVSSVATYNYLPGSDLVQGYTNDTGFSLARSYEPNRNLITQILNTSGTNLVSRFDYVNDEIGRRTLRFDSLGSLPLPLTNAFSYNTRSELEDAAMGTNTFNYRYDPIGNRRTSAISNQISEITTYAANSLNQYTNVADSSVSSNPSYDLDGNMTNYKDWTFVWDAENRLVLASNATTVVSNSYDYMSRRISKTVSGLESDIWNVRSDIRFVYQGWAMFKETTATTTNNYVYGLDLSGTQQGAGTIGGILSLTTEQPSNSTTTFYCYDANGNVTDLVGTNGQFLAQYQYDPYGSTILKSGTQADVNPFRFSSKYTDNETGFLYFGFRYYQPEIGRWVSLDPVEEGGGLNLFVFVKNNAITMVDYIGLMGTPPAQPTWPEPSCDFNILIPEVKTPNLNMTKQQMVAFPANTDSKPGFTLHERDTPKLKCCCDSFNKWNMTVWFHFSDQIFLANEQYAVYNPNKDAAQKHEQCHVEDHQSFFIDVWGAMVNALGGPYNSSAECSQAKVGVLAIYEAKVSEWKNRDKHPAERYGPGKPCYASGHWK
jgi:RHS repeat-associated protein